ncbi:MAG TPA: periplasmic heavy metal sensor [Terracidiphilus sp.]|nr:periplasmic heavy metal sensor [Terracidiphilus sp.]
MRNRTVARVALACATLVAAAGLACAQAPGSATAPGSGPGSGSGAGPGGPPDSGAHVGPGFGMHRGPMERELGPRGNHGQWWNSPRMVQELKLTDDQRKSMDKILLDHREHLIDLRANLDKAELLMKPMMSEDHPNEQQILAQIDKVATARAELEKANARFLLAIRAQLTLDQWKTLEANWSERHDRHDRWDRRDQRMHRGERMRRPMPPQPPAGAAPPAGAQAPDTPPTPDGTGEQE